MNPFSVVCQVEQIGCDPGGDHQASGEEFHCTCLLIALIARVSIILDEECRKSNSNILMNPFSVVCQVEQFGATREVTIKRAEKRLFQINQKSHQGDVWAIVCNTDCTIGQKLVSLQSIVTVSRSAVGRRHGES